MPAEGMAVADASALASMLFNEPRSIEVADRLGSRRIAAPTLLPYELASVARKKVVDRPDVQATVARALDRIDRLEIRYASVVPRRALELAIQTGVSTYDAAYLWLAREAGIPLVTLDDRMERTARKLGLILL